MTYNPVPSHKLQKYTKKQLIQEYGHTFMMKDEEIADLKEIIEALKSTILVLLPEEGADIGDILDETP